MHTRTHAIAQGKPDDEIEAAVNGLLQFTFEQFRELMQGQHARACTHTHARKKAHYPYRPAWQERIGWLVT